MKGCIFKKVLLLCAALPSAAVLQSASVDLTLFPETVLNRVDEKIYGHFLEHIYHSVNGGLWGELVWNRSFEENAAGNWRRRGDTVVQEDLGTNRRLVFGDPDWRDYEYTLEARKLSGNEGFLILFRVRSEKDFYWCNLGGWNNTLHSLERGKSGEGRWHRVGPSVRGSIKRGRWYRIKIRCEGSHISVWLDGKKLIDFTDPEGHLQGCVGIGTWATKAAFRNVKVKALDGRVLLDGFPESLARLAVARHWKAFGSARVELASEEALNGRFCQHIELSRGKAGLVQKPFCLKAGERYVGSLWAKGRAAGGIAVQFTSEGRVLAEKGISRLDSKWREFPFELKVAEDCPEAELRIEVRGPASVWLDQVSIMPASWKAEGGFRPDLVRAIAELKPPVIRWPGGCFASAYRWKAGIGPQHKRRPYPRQLWDDLEVNAFGTDEFIALCRKVGAEPLIVVNIGTRPWNGEVRREDFLREVCQWIEYCNGGAETTWGRVRAENGHPEPYNVLYWEIDNETWHMGAEAYAEAVRLFAQAMKKTDPRIKLIACGSPGYGSNGFKWNRVIIQKCADVIDYLSVHHYENPDRFAEGPALYEDFLRRTAELIASSKNPDLKIYISEWNAQSTDWRTGLYCGGILNAFERLGAAVGMAGPALFLRHVSAPAWDNAFINFDHCTWFPAPNYVVMRLWRSNYAPLRVELKGETKPLNVVATTNTERSRAFLKLVNPTADPVRVSLRIHSKFKIRSSKLDLVAPGDLKARNSLSEPRAVSPREAPVRASGDKVFFVMPPLSAGVLALDITKL